jgi:deoxyribodipyrimidine photo-lyase
VYANHDDDPDALARDAQVRGALAGAGIALHTSKDHVVFERSELLTQAGGPYAVFTAVQERLAAAARALLRAGPIRSSAMPRRWRPPPPGVALGVPALADIGFEDTDLHTLKLPVGAAGAQALLGDFLSRIDRYHETRDFPAVKGPSYLSTHLRFGTVSIRQLAREAWRRLRDDPHAGARGAEVWLSELVWRDFFHQVLHHHPHVVGHAFRPAYDAIRWEHGKARRCAFRRLVRGAHRLPAVDAAMHQLNRTGYMHNRLRHGHGQFPVQAPGARLAPG